MLIVANDTDDDGDASGRRTTAERTADAKHEREREARA